MLGALTQQGEQYRVGKYLGQRDDFNGAPAPFFTYEEVSEKTRRFDQIVQNLQTYQNSVVIRTTYSYKWKTQSKVQLQDDKIYIIVQIQEQNQPINPQSVTLLKRSCETLYYMELVQASEDD